MPKSMQKMVIKTCFASKPQNCTLIPPIQKLTRLITCILLVVATHEHEHEHTNTHTHRDAHRHTQRERNGTLTVM